MARRGILIKKRVIAKNLTKHTMARNDCDCSFFESGQCKKKSCSFSLTKIVGSFCFTDRFNQLWQKVRELLKVRDAGRAKDLPALPHCEKFP